MSETKTHYRRVFKSDHLGVADLEEMIESKQSLTVTIKEVKQHYGEKVAGKNIDCNVAYFKENIKPLVLNSTNSKIITLFNQSPFIEHWKNTKITLYIDTNVKMKGQIVGGVRISNVKPVNKAKPIFSKANFKDAKNAGADIKKIKSIYQITKEVETKYLEYVKTEK